MKLQTLTDDFVFFTPVVTRLCKQSAYTLKCEFLMWSFRNKSRYYSVKLQTIMLTFPVEDKYAIFKSQDCFFHNQKINKTQPLANFYRNLFVLEEIRVFSLP